MINNYNEFLVRAEVLGFMPLSKGFLADFTSLEAETEEKKWHTDDADTDPWQWRIRCVTEKTMAFGCLLGGDKGFITKEMYPYFYAACRPSAFPQELYHKGLLSPAAYELYQLFEDHETLTTAAIRSLMNQQKKVSTSKLDKATLELQRLFFITINGAQRKKNAKGEEYGWPSNQYTFIENWAPKEWLPKADSLTKAEARDFILRRAAANVPGCPQEKLQKKLFGKVDL